MSSNYHDLSNAISWTLGHNLQGPIIPIVQMDFSYVVEFWPGTGEGYSDLYSGNGRTSGESGSKSGSGRGGSKEGYGTMSIWDEHIYKETRQILIGCTLNLNADY